MKVLRIGGTILIVKNPNGSPQARSVQTWGEGGSFKIDINRQTLLSVSPPDLAGPDSTPHYESVVLSGGLHIPNGSSSWRGAFSQRRPGVTRPVRISIRRENAEKPRERLGVRIPNRSDVHQTFCQSDQRDEKSFGGERFDQPEEGSRCYGRA